MWTNVPELARRCHRDPAWFYEKAKREDDPFPLRYFEGDRYGVVSENEADEWLFRNSTIGRKR